MTVRCPRCQRLLCDHHVPRRTDRPARDERQLALPLEEGPAGTSSAIAPKVSVSSGRGAAS